MRRDLSNEARMLCESVRRFMQKEIVPVLEKIDHYPVTPAPQGFFDSLLSRLGELGLLSLMAPTEYGGSGLGVGILSEVVETMAEDYASVPALVLAHSIGQKLLVEAGTAEQKDRWLKPDESLARPAVLAFPMYHEPDSHGFLRECARDPKGEIAVEGTCDLVVNAPIADGFVLPVRLGDGMGLVVLPRETKGVSLSEPVLTLGLRACPVADVRVEQVKVPKEACIGSGASIPLKETYSLFSGPVAALSAGICGSSLKKAAAYVKERRQGGHVLAEYSQIQMMVAGMATRHETACRAAQRLSESGGLRDAEDIALFISARDGVARAVQDGVQLLGGYGYMEDYGQERCMRDAKQAQMILGRDDLRRLDIAALHLE